jgi:predicted nucleic acid-binding protein
MKVADTKRFVLDASVTVAWCFEDEASKLAESVLESLSKGSEALVPSLWPFEVANALLIAERRNRIRLAQVTATLRRISALPISVIPVDAEHAFEQILPLARQQRLTHYDAAYLELALHQGAPLATLDAEIRQAAKVIGVPLLSP